MTTMTYFFTSSPFTILFSYCWQLTLISNMSCFTHNNSSIMKKGNGTTKIWLRSTRKPKMSDDFSCNAFMDKSKGRMQCTQIALSHNCFNCWSCTGAVVTAVCEKMLKICSKEADELKFMSAPTTFCREKRFTRRSCVLFMISNPASNFYCLYVRPLNSTNIWRRPRRLLRWTQQAV